MCLEYLGSCYVGSYTAGILASSHENHTLLHITHSQMCYTFTNMSHICVRVTVSPQLEAGVAGAKTASPQPQKLTVLCCAQSPTARAADFISLMLEQFDAA